MAISTPFGKSIQVQYLEHDFPSEEKNSGCVLANLMSQSLSMYVELEKTHWHLRLNQARRAGNVEASNSAEIAGEVCITSLRLIASIHRLQRALDPDFSPECAALLAAVQEKIAEAREVQNERQFDSSEHMTSLVFQGAGSAQRTFRDTWQPENAKAL